MERNGDGVDDDDDDIGDGDALNGSYWREVSPPENGRRGTHRFVAQQPNNTLSTTHNPTTQQHTFYGDTKKCSQQPSNTFNTLCTASRKST